MSLTKHSMLDKYNDALRTSPMLTQSVSGAILFAAGDLLAQQVFEKNGWNHDFIRTIRGLFYSGVIMGPPMTLWYRYLNNLRAGSKNRATAIKVLLDQAFLSPFALLFFFICMSVLELQPEQIPERIHRAYFPSLFRSWIVFLPTQILNFSVVPPHLRLVVASVVSLFWNTYLSAVNAASQAPIAISEVLEMPETTAWIVAATFAKEG